MFCINCGNKIEENSKFCSSCGAVQENVTSCEARTNYANQQPLQQGMPTKKIKKKSKVVIAAVLSLVIVIGGAFAYRNLQPYINEIGNKEKSYSLDDANENAKKAYLEICEYFDDLEEQGQHYQDYFLHGFFSGILQPDGRKDIEQILGNAVEDGYIQIMTSGKKSDYYYADIRFTVQWCGDESGNGAVGQYPNPIQDKDENDVEFGTIFEYFITAP